MQPKNIVFIMADQLGARFLGCYGSGVDSSPSLDRLASQGMRFDRAYAHVPVCAPNRATFLTGRSPEIHGLVNNNLALTSHHPTYPQVLQKAGYRTGGFGKFHQSPMQEPLPADFSHLGFDESIPTEDPKLGPWLDWVEREHPEHYEKALAVSWAMPYCKDYGPEHRDLRKTMLNARNKWVKPHRQASPWALMYRSPLPAELHQTTYITDISLDFMQRHTQQHADQPFMCFVSYVDPHDPYDPPAPYDAMFDPEDMPDAIPGPVEGYPCETLEQSRNFHDFFKIANDPATLRKLRALYHGSIRFLDDQISRIFTWLEKSGHTEDTMVVFTTDHGEMLGDHGLITKGVKHYDSGIRVPLIVRGPGIDPGVTDQLASSLDIFPTFCDWAGATRVPPLEGKSLAPCCRGEQSSAWEQVTVQSPPNKSSHMVRSIITNDGWRFSVFQESGYGEMFNLRDDPDEQNNLYDDPAYITTRLSLHERLTRAYMDSTGVIPFPNLPCIDGEPHVPDESLGPLLPLYPHHR